MFSKKEKKKTVQTCLVLFSQKKNEKGACLAKTGRRIILLLINESQVVLYRPVSL